MIFFNFHTEDCVSDADTILYNNAVLKCCFLNVLLTIVSWKRNPEKNLFL